METLCISCIISTKRSDNNLEVSPHLATYDVTGYVYNHISLFLSIIFFQLAEIRMANVVATLLLLAVAIKLSMLLK